MLKNSYVTEMGFHKFQSLTTEMTISTYHYIHFESQTIKCPHWKCLWEKTGIDINMYIGRFCKSLRKTKRQQRRENGLRNPNQLFLHTEKSSATAGNQERQGTQKANDAGVLQRMCREEENRKEYVQEPKDPSQKSCGRLPVPPRGCLHQKLWLSLGS